MTARLPPRCALVADVNGDGLSEIFLEQLITAHQIIFVILLQHGGAVRRCQ